uniref:Uncharacterized protein n=1 Tax=Strongyloides venezuelensis TaxID=75913 RepID=A0A0K0FB98_STRVS
MNCYEEAIVMENSGSQICRLKRISNDREYVIHNDYIRKKSIDRKKVNKQNSEILLDTEAKDRAKGNEREKDSENTVTELNKEISEVLEEMHKNGKAKNPKIPTAPFTMSLRNSKRDFSQSSRMSSRPWRS